MIRTSETLVWHSDLLLLALVERFLATYHFRPRALASRSLSRPSRGRVGVIGASLRSRGQPEPATPVSVRLSPWGRGRRVAAGEVIFPRKNGQG